MIPNRNEFFARQKTHSPKMYKDVHFGVIASVPLLKLVFNVSERTGMFVLISSSEFAPQTPMFFVKQKSETF